MKITISSTFDFEKLLKKHKTIIEEGKMAMGKNYATEMRNVINSGNQLLKLTDFRVAQRGRGVHFPDGVYVTPTQDTTPLKQTGALLDSIKVKKDGLYMNHYGITHNEGIKDDYEPHVMKKRPFIDIAIKQADTEKATKEFMLSFSKALKARGGKKILSSH